MTEDIPVPRLTRLEYYGDKGWETGHAGIALLSPERYVERLGAKGKIARATVLGDRTMMPTEEVYEIEGADLL